MDSTTRVHAALIQFKAETTYCELNQGDRSLNHSQRKGKQGEPAKVVDEFFYGTVILHDVCDDTKYLIH